MSRKTAREKVFKLVYERCVNDAPNDFSLQLALEETDEADAIYIRKIYEGVNEKYDFLKECIERYAKGFSFARIYKIDCALLMIAAYEILYLDDIPTQVSVNEALELAKVYSTEKSFSFINGLLASVNMNKEELLHEQDN